MSLPDELKKLTDLYDDGVLTQEEFAEAKRQLLHPPQQEDKSAQNSSLDSAVDKYVSFQVVSGIVGLIVFIAWVAFLMSHVK